MNAIIEAVIHRSRAAILVLLLVIASGIVSYNTIPKESEPDINIPIVYVSMSHEGISPYDAERLLVRPMEKELRSVEGIKELRAEAREGQASITLEFEAGHDIDQALLDVREKVDTAKTELPADTDEPTVNEVNFALFPVLVVTLSGNLPEEQLFRIARNLRDQIEGLESVLEVEIGGNREDLLEVIIDPAKLESYNLSQQDVFNFVSNNNQLVAAGAMDNGQGRFSIKVPGLIENITDILNLPVKVDGDRIVTFSDIALARRTYKDPEGFARVNGLPSLTLEVSKRIGTNIIDTIHAVKHIVESAKKSLPDNLEIQYSQDKSKNIRDMLTDLQNNVATAIILVMIVLIATLGWRSAFLVGLISIPGSFLAAILVIDSIGLTVNMVVLFSLIMAIGMLVDGAIVVAELADRKMAEGEPRERAYMIAAKRMAWPITTATATTLAAFMPLLFWPGIVGEFMKYLPITLIATLTASLAMALLFVPTLGSLLGRRAPDAHGNAQFLAAAESGPLDKIGGFTGMYIKFLGNTVRHPGKVVLVAVMLLFGSYILYALLGKGIEFFPEVEPEQAIIHVSTRGNLSIHEKDALLKEIENRILDIQDFKSIYARSGQKFKSEVNEDVFGVIQLELKDWEDRRPAAVILDEVRQRTKDLAGITIEVRKQEAGPPIGKPIQLQISHNDYDALSKVTEELRNKLEQIEGLQNISDTRPIPGIEWEIAVDRARAARFGADVKTIGNAIQLTTNGIKVGEYRPDDAEDEVEIRLRYPHEYRNLNQLERINVSTDAGLVPVTNFVDFIPAAKTGTIKRADQKRILKIEAEVEEGILVDNKVNELKQWLTSLEIPAGTEISFKGEDEEQNKAKAFLSRAFIIALAIIGIILVTQFNSLYQASLILSAVIFSTVGVLLGLLISQQAFSIVMSGIGVISLAGIVVNNNIVLIDTYNFLRNQGMEVIEAIQRTGALRLRPVVLTTVTTILGLMPMVLGVNIDLINRELTVGSPSTQWWIQLSSAVSYGLAFATVLTLVVTPTLLIIGEKMKHRPTEQPAISVET